MKREGREEDWTARVSDCGAALRKPWPAPGSPGAETALEESCAGPGWLSHVALPGLVTGGVLPGKLTVSAGRSPRHHCWGLPNNITLCAGSHEGRAVVHPRLSLLLSSVWRPCLPVDGVCSPV